MGTAYIILALLNFAYGFLVRNNTSYISLERHKNSSILNSIEDSTLLTEQAREPNEREDSGNKETEHLNLLHFNNKNNKYISITKRETGDVIKERSENKTTIRGIKDVSHKYKANQHSIHEIETYKSNNDYENKKTAVGAKDSSDNHLITNQSRTTRPVNNNQEGNSDDNIINDDVPSNEYKIKPNGDINAEFKNQITNRESRTATDKVISKEMFNVRPRRSSPGLMKMLKHLFATNTETNTFATVNVETIPIPITRQTPEDMNNDEKDKIVVNKQYVDKLLSKLDKLLLMLSEKLAYEDLTDDNGYIIVKIPLTLDGSRRSRSKRDTNIKLTKDELNVNATENNNDTKSMKDIAQTIITNFEEVQNEMAPIKTIKDKFSTHKIYKVGYIIAHLETLELTLKKMVDQLSSKELNKTQALKIRDKVELSKAVVSNLMRHLDTFSKLKSE